MPDDAPNSYDPFASEKYESPLLADWAKQAAPKDEKIIGQQVQGLVSLLPRLFGAVQASNEQMFGPGPKTMSTDDLPWQMNDRTPGLAAEAALNVMSGAGLVGGEANTLRAGMKFPEGYYDKIPQEMRLSRIGISHPGYRWEVFDPKTGNVMRKDLATKSGANMSKDRLDNAYGGYRYQVRPARAQKLTEAEDKILKEKGIDLDAAESVQTEGGPTEFRSGMGRLPARNNPITGRKQVAPQQKLTDMFVEGGGGVQPTPRGPPLRVKGKFANNADYFRNRVPTEEELTPIQKNPMYDPANPPAPVTSRLESPAPQDPASVERNLNKLPNSFTLGSGPTDSKMSAAMQGAAQSVRDTKPTNFWGDTLKTLRGFQQDKAPIVDKFRQEAHNINNPPPGPGSLESMMGKIMGKSDESVAGSAEAGSLENMMQRTMARTNGPSSPPVSPIERNASKMPNSFMQGAVAAPVGMAAAEGQGQDAPQMSPGVAKFLMEFLKANPDLAKEMSTRMQAVINGKQIQGQQQATGQPQMPPQGPVNGP